MTTEQQFKEARKILIEKLTAYVKTLNDKFKNPYTLVIDGEPYTLVSADINRKTLNVRFIYLDGNRVIRKRTLKHTEEIVFGHSMVYIREEILCNS